MLEFDESFVRPVGRSRSINKTEQRSCFDPVGEIQAGEPAERRAQINEADDVLDLHSRAAGPGNLNQQRNADQLVVERRARTEQGVIAYAGSEGFLVDSKAGTINPVADGEPARCVDSNAIADTSSLAVMPSADWPASVAGLRVATARSRDLGAGATLWLAVGAADGRPIVAKVQHGQVLWHIGLGRSSGSFAWVPANAVSNGTHWFVPYVDGGIARLAAIDNSTGAQVWDIEILTRPGKPQEWHVCAMDAGPNLVGLAHKRMNDCDELVLVDAVAGKVAYRYKRN